MGDLLVGLQSEAKAFRHALGPIQKGVLGGHAIETVIDFDRRELLGIEAEHFAVGKLPWIEAALPLLIGVSGSAHAKLSWVRDRRPPWRAIKSQPRRWENRVSHFRYERLLHNLAKLLISLCGNWVVQYILVVFLHRWRDPAAERFDSILQSLTSFPEIAPEITLLL